MLDINFIRENSEKVKKGVVAKQINPKVIDDLLELDEKRRALLQKLEAERAEKNIIAREVATNKTEELISRGKIVKAEIQSFEGDLRDVDKAIEKTLHQVPNLPASDVPVGKDESENVEVKKWGKIPKFNFNVRDHLELGEILDIIDVKRAAKVSGTRFGYLKNEGAILEFALVQLAFETLIKEGFIPVVPPALLRLSITEGLGYWEHGQHEDWYLVVERQKEKTEEPDFYLAGTAEHSIIPMHMEEILEAKDLPLRYVGFSSCFRREAGSYGKDTRGIFRVHQFDKMEMVSFVEPTNGDKEHEYFLSLEEKLVQKLEIPYQITKMCTGDLGHPAARKYDIECWFPSEKKYRETHSTSSCTDFQARRLNIKYKDGKETGFVHTLNGTAFAIGRMILAILENYQQKDGSVLVPKVLQKYTGFKKIEPKK